MNSSLHAFKCCFLEMRDLTVIDFNILPCKMEKFVLTRHLSLVLLPDQCWESLLRVLGEAVGKHRVKQYSGLKIPVSKDADHLGCDCPFNEFLLFSQPALPVKYQWLW